jgi:putative ABC transport system substrate-binding protein
VLHNTARNTAISRYPGVVSGPKPWGQDAKAAFFNASRRRSGGLAGRGAGAADRKVARVGYVGTNRNFPFGRGIYQSFLDQMRKLGFNEGQNLIIDFRPLEQELRALAAEVAELVRLKADVILTDGTEVALQAALEQAHSIPIVMIATNFDPIAHGYIQNLARPGGNVTGLFLRQTELAEKQTELLFEALSDKKRLGVLWDEISMDQFAAAEQRAKAFGLSVQSVRLRNPPYDFEAAFRTLAEALPQMLLVLSSPNFAPYAPTIAQLAIRYRLPAMFIFRSYVEAGGLMSYGADYFAMHRQAATYVAKILRGAKPSDLPVEQPNTYELVLNLTTARAIGLDLPTATQLRADEVIE